MALRSVIEHVAWPALPGGQAAELMALQRQFDASQWWPPARLRAAQFAQLRLLVAHAARHVPFHQARLAAAGIAPDTPLTEEAWASLPVLTRHDVQREGDALHAPSPPSHGATTEAASGGSTGVPVRVRKTQLGNVLWNACHIREEIWHRQDHSGTIARVRGVPLHFTPDQVAAINSPEGLHLPDWGPPISLIWHTGPMLVMNYRVPIATQVAFLQRNRPDYLLTFPSNLRLLLAELRGTSLPMRSVWTFSEAVDDAMREACHAVFGCRILHNYSAAETGYIALQCPNADSFHIQAETVLVEVLDQAGRPCAPGEIGRVIVTPLHSFAMPLLRYEIGDEAELGPPCPCGRGLPVLTRIVGRTLDYLILPSGQQRRVEPAHYAMSKIPAVREFQIVQRSLERIEIRMVVARPLTEAEEADVRRLNAAVIGDDFAYDLIYCEAIPRTPGGKLRPFMCDLPPASPDGTFATAHRTPA